MSASTITVFAPATVANVNCAFDILGFAVPNPGDIVTLTKTNCPEVVIEEIIGDQGRLPKAADKNTASVAILSLLKQLDSPCGFSIKIKKGLPCGSGLGSSAASAAAAVFAANQLLGEPLKTEELVPFAMLGEKIACGTAHADNVAPALLGGFVLVRSYQPLDLIRIPVPKTLHCTLIHPKIEIQTSAARQVLKQNVALTDAVKQWGNTAGLLAGLFQEDYALIGRSLEDHIIEPNRALLIPGFNGVKEAAIRAGALGCGISGSGPTLFALSSKFETAQATAKAMQQAFGQIDIETDAYVSKIAQDGARIVD